MRALSSALNAVLFSEPESQHLRYMHGILLLIPFQVWFVELQPKPR